MSLLSKFKKYKTKILIEIILLKFFNTQFLKIHYFKYNLNSEYLQKKVADLDLNVKELTYEDFLLGDKNVFNGKKLILIKQRLSDQNYRSYGIIENNLLIYSSWISLKKFGLPVNSDIQLMPTEGYLEDDYCYPTFRGRGIHGKMVFYRLAKLDHLGKTECLVTVLDGNAIALNTHIKLGAKYLGSFYAGKIFGMSFATLNKNKNAS